MGAELKVIDKIALITINRPEAMNAIDPETNEQLDRIFDEFAQNRDLWVAVLTGAGEKAFSAGADLKKMVPFNANRTAVDGRESMEKPHAAFGSILRNYTCFKPIIAAVNGICLGGGLEIALACDIRYASENAKFGLPETKWGLIPGGGGTQRLPRTISRSYAMEMMFTGKTIDAEEALRVGLVSRVVPQSELLDVTLELAQTICERAPLAVRGVKECVMRGEHMALEDALRYEVDMRDFLRHTEDAKEGPRAFAEKRKPEFKAQ